MRCAKKSKRLPILELHGLIKCESLNISSADNKLYAEIKGGSLSKFVFEHFASSSLLHALIDAEDLTLLLEQISFALRSVRVALRVHLRQLRQASCKYPCGRSYCTTFIIWLGGWTNSLSLWATYSTCSITYRWRPAARSLRWSTSRTRQRSRSSGRSLRVYTC